MSPQPLAVRTAIAAAVVATGVLAAATGAQAGPTGVLAGTTGTQAGPTGTQTSVTQAFHAVSGDNCRYGQTDGELDWWTASAGTVNVKGALIDRPTANDPSICTDDRRYSYATFTAYAGRTQVDQDQRRVDNARVDFTFTLGSNTSVARVDRVVVQVCRASLISPTQPVYCGPAQSYSPIATTP